MIYFNNISDVCVIETYSRDVTCIRLKLMFDRQNPDNNTFWGAISVIFASL